MLQYFKFENSQDLFYRVGIGSVDNKKLKEFSNEYNNSLLNFLKEKFEKIKIHQKLVMIILLRNLINLFLGKKKKI